MPLLAIQYIFNTYRNTESPYRNISRYSFARRYSPLFLIHFWMKMKSFRDYLGLSNSCLYNVDDVIGRADRFEFQNFCSPDPFSAVRWFSLPRKTRNIFLNLKSTHGLKLNKCLSFSDFSHIFCHLTNPDFFAASFTSPKDNTGGRFSFSFASCAATFCQHIRALIPINICMSWCPWYL